jgi:hypothetical protein
MRRRSLCRVALIAAIALFARGSRADACDTPNGNDQLSDYQAIQCLLDLGGTVVLDADTLYAYFIDHPLVLRVNGTTLTSTSAYGNSALIEAMPDLDRNGGGPILSIDPSVTSYTLSNLWFYGDRFDRPNPVCAGDRGANVWVRGNGAFPGALLLSNIESDTAPCGTSMNVAASNFEIHNSWFANNGYPGIQGGGGGPYADGLTVWMCDHGYIHDNNFRDNTDIDVVIGGGPGCRVEYNTIQHILAHGWAGIHVGYFNGGNGDHSGSTYVGNTVSSSDNQLSFAVVVGFHPWGSGLDLVNVGQVDNNTLSGAVFNLTVDASWFNVLGEVQGNSASGHRGNFGLGSCTLSADYTVYLPHAGQINLQSDWLDMRYDDGTCIPQ